MTVQELRNRFAKLLRVDIGEGKRSNCSIGDLKDVLSQYRLNSEEGCPVRLRLSLEEARGEVVLGKTWNVSLEDSLLEVLRKKFGPDAVHLNYT